MPRLAFRMGDAFPARDPIARWVMNLSMALGDLRIVAEYVTRPDQAEHERLYFVRIFASHLREIAKLLVRDYDGRQYVRDFVATLPPEAQQARKEAERMLHDTFEQRPGVVVWRDLKRVRDDTFHYASDDESQKRLEIAMQAVADIEGAYSLDDEGRLRAEYADLVSANRMHPFKEDETLPITQELHERFIALHKQVALFIHHAEDTYLLKRVAEGIVKREE